jgi:Zn-dependent protease with chaperone function
MGIKDLWPPRSTGSRRDDPGAGLPWPLALGCALALTRCAAVLLSPREGLLEPIQIDVGDYLDADDIVRARRFARPQQALQLAGGVVQAATLAAFVRRPPRRAGASLTAGGLSLVVGLAPLPLRALARRRALEAGLATQSWRGWALDVFKGAGIELALAAGLAPAGVGLMRRYPRAWWLPGAAVSVIGATTFSFLAPVLLDPLFNDFTPLAPGQVREDVLELARRAGVRVGEVYEVDASRRTTAANAYVTGLGATKRVVLFDTLLGELTREETRLVVAHELAHVRHRDVPRGLLQLTLSAPGATYAVAQLTRRLDRSHGLEPSASTLPALALSFALVGALTGSLSTALSRRIEARADCFSLRLTDAPEAFVAFERRVVRQNLLDPQPPRWLVSLLATHPPVAERIGMAEAYSSSSASAPPYSGRFLMPSRVRHLE